MHYEELKACAEATGGKAVTELLPLLHGDSDCLKAVATVEGEEWMVKLFPAVERRILWYEHLSQYTDERLRVPRKFRYFPEGKLCTMVPWIRGENLQHVFACCSQEEMEKYGAMAGDLLALLHSRKVIYEDYGKLFCQRVEAVIRKVREANLHFPGMEACVKFLREKTEHYVHGELLAIHRDIHPGNFILRKGELFLVDFENGGIGERAGDFSYVITMGNPDYKVFYRALLRRYFREGWEVDFWEKNLIYTSLALLEYALWKWHKKGRQVSEQGIHFLDEYENFTRVIPKSMEEFQF